MCFAGKILRSWIKSYRQKHYFNCQRLTDFVKRSINYIFRSPKWRNSTVTTSSWGLKLTTWGLRCKAVSITLTKTSTSRIYFYRYFTLRAASDSCAQNSILSAFSFIFCFTSFSNYRFIKRRQPICWTKLRSYRSYIVRHDLRFVLKSALSEFFMFVFFNPCQSSPSSTILVSLWFIITSLMLSYFSN